MDNQEALLELTADIVGAHVSNNRVDHGHLPELISSVYASLACLGTPAVPEPEKREPAVSVRSSVKPDHLVCLVCGTKNKMLKRHISTAHDMTPQEYRELFELRANYPMIAPECAEKRRDIAKQIGLGTNPNQRRGRRKKTS